MDVTSSKILENDINDVFSCIRLTWTCPSHCIAVKYVNDMWIKFCFPIYLYLTDKGEGLKPGNFTIRLSIFRPDCKDPISKLPLNENVPTITGREIVSKIGVKMVEIGIHISNCIYLRCQVSGL